MPRTTTIPRFNVGDKVRVSSGVSDPDYDDLTICGWAGTIAEVQNGTPPTLLVRWTKQTLKKQSPIYRKRCERDGFDGNEMWLVEGDLEPDIGGPITIERSNNVVTRPLSMNDQDDRIRAVFELTSNDPLPEAHNETLVTYFKYLANKLSFPFEAKYSFETGPGQCETEVAVVFLGSQVIRNPDLGRSNTHEREGENWDFSVEIVPHAEESYHVMREIGSE